MDNETERLVADNKLASAFLNLRTHPDWDSVREWLVEQLAVAREQNDRLEGVALYRSQGRALTLSGILEQADDAASVKARVMAAMSRRVRKEQKQSVHTGGIFVGQPTVTRLGG
jgi:hypothetical protein